MKEKVSLTEYNKGYPIFTGCFLVDPVLVGEALQWKLSNFHVTYDFNPGDPKFPDNVIEGDFAKIRHIAVYQDANIVASRVNLTTMNGSILNRQRDGGLPLHITWAHGKAAPKASGYRLNKLYDDWVVDNAKEGIHNHKDEYGESWKRYNTMYELLKHGFDFPDDEDHYSEKDMIVSRAFKELEPIGIWHTMRQVDNPDGVKVSLEEEE